MNLTPFLLLFTLSTGRIFADFTFSPEGPHSFEVGFGQEETLELSVTNTGPAPETVGVYFPDSIGSTLDGTRNELNENTPELLLILSDRFQFSEGEAGTSISDGGGDMYDGGNILRFGGTNAPVLPYSDDIVNTDIAGISYFTKKFEGLFILAADYESHTSFDITGNLGADGGGSINSFQFDPGQGYRAFVKSVRGTSDPSVNHLILVPDSAGLAQTVDSSTDSDGHSITGLPPGGRIYFLLFAKNSGETFPNETIEEFATAFLRKVSPGPPWIDWNHEVSIPSGTTRPFTINLDSATLEAGPYNAKLAIAPDGTDSSTLSEGDFMDLSFTVRPPTFTLSHNEFEIGAIIGAPIDPVRVELIPGTGFINFDDLEISTDQAWLNVSRVAGEDAIQIAPDSVGNSSAEISLTSGGTKQTIQLEFLLAPLSISHLLPDPLRPRLYAINQNDKEQGSVLVIDTLTHAVLRNIPVGLEPTDLALTEDSAELLVMNTSDPSIHRINLETFETTEKIPLSEFSNRNDDVGGHVIDGPGNIIYYIDEQWGPRLRVFDTSTQTVLQTFGSTSTQSPNTNNDDGFGDVKISPDGTRLFGWRQYGDGAGSSGTTIVRYTIAPDGTLSQWATGPFGSSGNFQRAPFDSPILFSSDGSLLILKNSIIDQESLQTTQRLPDEIFSLSPSGTVAIGANEIYSTQRGTVLRTLGANLNIQAFLPDYSSFVYVVDGDLVWLDLMAALGPETLGVNLSPSPGSTISDASLFTWPPSGGVFAYDFYVGTDETAVRDADANSPEFQGSTSNAEFSFTSTLAPGTYFWKSAPSGTVSSPVYSFTIAELQLSTSSVEITTLEGITRNPGEIALSSQSPATWQATAQASWIELINSSGTTPDKLSYSINTSSLAPGFHDSTLTLASGSSTITIPVNIRVEAANYIQAEGDSERPFIYAISQSSTDQTLPAFLVKIDTETNQFVQAVQCGRRVSDFTIHYKEDRIYLSNLADNAIRAFDRTTLEEVQIYNSLKVPDSANPGQYTLIDLDAFKLSAGPAGQLMIEGDDQWIDIVLMDTNTGIQLGRKGEREGDGTFSQDGNTYYHGDNNSSGAILTTHDLTSSNLDQVLSIRDGAYNSYGNRNLRISGNGSVISWGGSVFTPELELIGNFGDNNGAFNSRQQVRALSHYGDIASYSSFVTDLNTGAPLGDLPVTTDVQAIPFTQDRIFLFSGNSFDIFDLSSIISLSPVKITPGIEDGSTVFGTNQDLTWSGLPSAIHYDLYFGTDANAVMTATKGSPEFRGTTTDLGLPDAAQDLQPGERYYWRIDYQNSTDLIAGEVFEFTVAPLVISPPRISINAPVGAPIPSQAIDITATVSRDWSANATPRLTLAKASGSTDDTLIFELNTNGLGPGTHRETITFTVGPDSFDYEVVFNLFEVDITRMIAGLNPETILAISTVPGFKEASHLLEVEASTGAILRYLEVGETPLDLAVASSTQRIYFVSPDGEPSAVVDYPTWKNLPPLVLPEYAYSIEATPDGPLLVGLGYGYAEIVAIDPETGEEIYRTSLSRISTGRHRPMALSADGSILYTTNGNNQISSYQINEDKLTLLNFRPRSENSGNFQGEVLVARDGSSVFFQDFRLTDDLQERYRFKENFQPLTIDSRGLLAVGENKIVMARSGELIATLPVSTSQAQISGNDQYLVRFNNTTRLFESAPLAGVVALPGSIPQSGEQVFGPVPLLSIAEITGATSYQLYWGRTSGTLQLAGTSETSVFAAPDDLPAFGKIFWRIDALNGVTSTQGSLNNFEFIQMAATMVVEATPNQISVNDGIMTASASASYGRNPIWLKDVTDDPQSNLPMSLSLDQITNEQPYSGSTHIMAGGRLITNDFNTLKGYESNRFGSYSEVISLSMGTPTTRRLQGLTGSGDIIFAARQQGTNSTQADIPTYRAYPDLALEQTIQVPSSNSSVNGFGDSIHSGGDLLVVSNSSYNRRGSLYLWIYRRSSNPTNPWLLADRVILNRSDFSDARIDTDGERIAVLYSDNNGKKVSVIEAISPNNFEVRWSANAQSIGSPYSTNPTLSDVAIDQDLLVIGAPNTEVRLNQSSSVFVYERTGTSWTKQTPLSMLSNREGAQLVEAYDGKVFATDRNSIHEFDLNPNANKHPRFTSSPRFQAVAGRPYSALISVEDDSDSVTITADQIPSWMTLEEANGFYRLTGTSPSSTNYTSPIRIKATDSDGISSFQTYTLSNLRTTDLPTVVVGSNSRTFGVGQELDLNPQTGGIGPFTWQWYLNGEPINGATAPRYRLNQVDLENSGVYTVEVTNAVGSVTSAPIEITVNPANRFAGDWPTLGSSPRHLGHHPATLGSHRFMEAWSQQVTENQNVTRPVIADGKIFVVPAGKQDDTPMAIAYSLQNGEELWSRSHGNSGTLNPPSYYQGRLYLQRGNHSRDSQLWALDTSNGNALWSSPFTAQWERYEAPAVNEEGIWINGGSYGGMYGFNHDGTEKFYRSLPQQSQWTPTLQNNRVYTWVSGTFTAHDPESGSANWFKALRDQDDGASSTTGVMAITEKEALFRNDYSTLVCLDLESREVRWETPRATSESGYGYPYPNVPSVAHGSVFAISNNKVVSHSLETGEIERVFSAVKTSMVANVITETAEKLVSVQPVILNDHLIVASNDLTFIFSLETGEIVQTLGAGGSVIYSEGYLVVTAFDGLVSTFFANDIPDINLATLPDMIEDVPFSVSLDVVHDDPNETLTLTLQNAPNFISISQDGTLTGLFESDVVTTEYTFEVEASDGVNPPVSRQYTLKLVNVNDPPQITPFEVSLVEDGPAFTIPLSQVVFDEETALEDLVVSMSVVRPRPEGPVTSNLTENGTIVISPHPDQFGDFQINLTVRDSGDQLVEINIPVSVSPVPDPPRINVAIEDQSTNDAADDLTLDLAQAFLDPDPGEVLTYSLTGNTNAAIFSNIAFEGSLLRLRFAPYRSGSSDLTITATDPGGLTLSQTFTVVLPDLPPAQVTTGGQITLNRRTGLYEQTITVTNTAARAIGGFSLTIGGLTNGYILYGLPNNSLAYHQAIEPGASVTLVLEYHSPTSREIPTPNITAVNVLPEETPAAEPGDTHPDRVSPMPDGSMLLEFVSTPGRTYQIQYSQDLATWHNSPVLIIATANRTQWLDHGLPKTNCHPADCQMRLYRVFEIPVATND